MTQEALKLAEIIEHFDSNDESLPLELLKEISATLRALALQALHDENERLGLYKDAYAEQEPVVCCQQYDTCLQPCTPRGEHLAQRTEQEPWCMKMNGCKTKCEDCPVKVVEPEQEPVAWHEIVLNQKQFLEKMEWLLAKTASPPWRERVLFPTMPRKMWSGGEVQQWLDENVNKENT